MQTPASIKGKLGVLSGRGEDAKRSMVSMKPLLVCALLGALATHGAAQGIKVTKVAEATVSATIIVTFKAEYTREDGSVITKGDAAAYPGSVSFWTVRNAVPGEMPECGQATAPRWDWREERYVDAPRENVLACEFQRAWSGPWSVTVCHKDRGICGVLAFERKEIEPNGRRL